MRLTLTRSSVAFGSRIFQGRSPASCRVDRAVERRKPWTHRGGGLHLHPAAPGARRRMAPRMAPIVPMAPRLQQALSTDIYLHAVFFLLVAFSSSRPSLNHRLQEDRQPWPSRPRSRLPNPPSIDAAARASPAHSSESSPHPASCALLAGSQAGWTRQSASRTSPRRRIVVPARFSGSKPSRTARAQTAIASPQDFCPLLALFCCVCLLLHIINASMTLTVRQIPLNGQSAKVEKT